MTDEELGFEMIRTGLRAGGLPESGWLRHPVPTAQEPGKEVRWIAENPDMELDAPSVMTVLRKQGPVS